MTEADRDRPRQQVSRQERELHETLELKQEATDLKWLMSRKQGRRIVWRLLEAAGVYRSVFNANAMVMSFAEGHRNAGLRLLQALHASCHELVAVMFREHKEGERAGDDGRIETTRQPNGSPDESRPADGRDSED